MTLRTNYNPEIYPNGVEVPEWKVCFLKGLKLGAIFGVFWALVYVFFIVKKGDYILLISLPFAIIVAALVTSICLVYHYRVQFIYRGFQAFISHQRLHGIRAGSEYYAHLNWLRFWGGSSTLLIVAFMAAFGATTSVLFGCAKLFGLEV